MAGIRGVVHDVWQEKGLGHLPLEDQIEVALAQFGGRHSEEKIAGVLMLAELLVDSLETEHVADLARPFELDQIQDWSTCDWYCVKAIGRFVAHEDRARRARRVAEWRHAPGLWQRRAAAVSFVNHAPLGEGFFRGFTKLLITVCRRNVQDPARFSQTSVGWLLREFSKADPQSVSDFVDRYGDQMSREGFKAATKHL